MKARILFLTAVLASSLSGCAALNGFLVDGCLLGLEGSRAEAACDSLDDLMKPGDGAA